MNEIKLQQWLPVLLFLLLISCGHKNITGISKQSAGFQPPPALLEIKDEQASINQDGELYYWHPPGFIYWKKSDGKYYLDTKYEKNGYQIDKKNKLKKKQKSIYFKLGIL